MGKEMARNFLKQDIKSQTGDTKQLKQNKC